VAEPATPPVSQVVDLVVGADPPPQARAAGIVDNDDSVSTVEIRAGSVEDVKHPDDLAGADRYTEDQIAGCHR
jgi:hypothetical protein